MECDHTTTLDCVHHEHSSLGHGIEMVCGNMGCDHTIAWNCPINSRGMRAKRCGRGYPEGVYTFERAGLMSAAKSTLNDDVHHRILPPWGLYLFKIPAPFHH